MANQIAAVLPANQARVNVTWGGQNGELTDPVPWDASDRDLKFWVTEAVRSGSVTNIRADARADFTDFVIDRYNATAETPYNRIFVRPKTPFGVEV